MEPFTAASTFATIVGLISRFRQEKGARAALDHRSFMEWLEYHRHEELKNLISSTAALRNEVDSLLHSDHEQMIRKLDEIGEVLATLLSRTDEFRGLAAEFAPNAELSEQAVAILRRFVDSDADFLLHRKWQGGTDLVLGSGSGIRIEITEPRFIDDDLQSLVTLGLLSPDYSEGDPFYRITRSAVKLVSAIGARTHNH